MSSSASQVEPLLLHNSKNPIMTDTLMMKSHWPTVEASRLRFEIPESWRDVRKEYGSGSFCQLRYNPEDRYLHIVLCSNNDDPPNADNNVTIFDTIDVEDMIGADLQIELLPEQNDEANTNPIDNNNNNDRASNEPPTDELRDTRGKAILTLYVYPRMDPSTQSICNKWNITTYRPPVRTPQYARPTTTTSEYPYPPRLANHRRLVLAPSEDLYNARNIVKALRTLAVTDDDGQQHGTNPKKYRIIVNPQSGPKRNAVQIAQEIVIPMLRDQAGIETTLEITTHPGHAGELVQNNNINDSYDGIIVMGGDGILHEVLNGMQNQHSTESVVVGVIGCGTSNGLATSITHAAKEASGILQNVFLIAKGRTIPADLATMQIKRKTDGQVQTYTSFLTFSWGIIADIDLESECLRFLGESRLDVWAVWRIIWKRTYRAKFSYTNDETLTELPDFSDPLTSWTTIHDEIVLFWTTLVTHAGKSTFHSPHSKFDDGIFQILLVRGKVSRYRLTRILLALEHGGHVDMPGLEWITCKAFRLEPDDADVSYNDIDGEAVERGPIQGMVLPKAVKYFGNIAK